MAGTSPAMTDWIDRMVGESKRRLLSRAEMLRTHPWCIFCGGETPATTTDHVPPITVFDTRQRPKGLEFPACDGCNSGSRPTDQIVGYLSRLFPNSTTSSSQAELKKILRGISNNQPELLKEMLPTIQQRERFLKAAPRMPKQTHAFNASGPIFIKHMHRFAAKLGLALHFELTNRILPRVGTVSVIWFTNYQALDTGIPKEILDLVGPPDTLRSGRVNVSDQFTYSTVVTVEGTASAHFATFRMSFATLSFASENGQFPDAASKEQLFRPGFLLKRE
jgi:hypothetical protein